MITRENQVQHADTLKLSSFTPPLCNADKLARGDGALHGNHCCDCGAPTHIAAGTATMTKGPRGTCGTTNEQGAATKTEQGVITGIIFAGLLDDFSQTSGNASSPSAMNLSNIADDIWI
eukprot:TRINITY_DN52493_c0_g1_i1.p1 TRINITY_DN52493_c0_g1~~TRINITY_DN52493_c0_g1_i1.p1  ORF type:complete len:119 (-),score=20.81 TRINITY_DN52493_c0_g1_i1:117-473(-)